jgi:hypothetical protein
MLPSELFQWNGMKITDWNEILGGALLGDVSTLYHMYRYN